MNSKWNRVLTGAATVSLALGTMAPMAFAASASTQYNTRTMNVGQGYTAVVSGVVAQDQGHATEFLPIYYMNQGLSKLGYTVNWNGNTRVLNITTPAGVTVTAPTTAVGTPGANQMVIAINGTNVKVAPRVVAKDPGSGVNTTYVPVYYLTQTLESIGFTSTYDGQTWGLKAPASTSTSTSAGLSEVTVSNQSNGTGTEADPAVSLKGTAISLSTTLTDASGNPMPNTAVTYQVSNYGTLPTNLPVVENASGTVISGTQNSTYESYTVYTNNQGVATISVNAPSSDQAYAYEVVATAPYSSGTAQTAISSQPVYVEYVSNNYAGFAPYASDSQPFVAAYNKAVPVSIILPPNAQGQPQANVLLTLNATTTDTSGNALAGSAAGTAGAFMSPSGANEGSQIQVTTNSNGIAQFYVGNPNTTPSGELLQISVASNSLPSGVNIPSQTYFKFVQGGIASQISNFSISSTSPNIGQNVYVSGQLEDESGNPTPNAQILVTSPNNQSNDFAYVTGTTTTSFPLVATSLAQNSPATTAYGDLVTADANGNFSFALTDPRGDTNITYSIYSVSNGEVQQLITKGVPSGDESISFSSTSTLAYLSIGGVDGIVQSGSNTTLTGLTAQVDNGAGGLGQLVSPTDTGTNSQIADVYVEPQNQSGKVGHGGNINQPETYNLTAANGGLIYSINGTTLNSPSGAVTVTYSPGNTTAGQGLTTPSSASSYGTFTVNGQIINSLNQSSTTTLSGSAGALPEDFEVGVVNNNTGATNLTVQSGNVSSTATVTFQGGSPDQIANFAPGNATVTAGQSQTVTFQMQDYTGNPVPNVAAKIMTDASSNDPFYITKVNGVTLQEQLNMGDSNSTSYAMEATPIPLGAVPSTLNYSVSMPGVVQWTNPGTSASSNPITIYSDANGNVSLQLQAGGLNYPSQYSSSQTVSGAVYGSGAVNPINAAPIPTTTGLIGFYTDTNGDTGTVPMYIVTGALSGASYTSLTAPTPTQIGNSSAKQSNILLQGTMGWN